MLGDKKIKIVFLVLYQFPNPLVKLQNKIVEKMFEMKFTSKKGYNYLLYCSE